MSLRHRFRSRQHGSVLTPYLFILPNFLIFLLFIVIPALFGFYYAFTDWDGLNEIKWIGLDNFREIFASSEFWETLGRTIIYSVITVPLLFAMALFLAGLLIREIRMKGLFRAIFYWPTMISFIVVGVTWKWMLGYDFGIINHLLSLAGYEPVKWLTEGFYANLAVIWATVWSRTGFYMVMFIAGLQSIPVSYYEAADIDGANPVRKFFHITLPLLKPTSFLVLILSMIDAFKSYAMIFSLTAGGPNKATTYLVQSIYEFAFQENRMGYASALSVVLFAILCTLTFVQFKANKGGEVR